MRFHLLPRVRGREHNAGNASPKDHGVAAGQELGLGFALVADLGLDKVLVYRFNAQDGSLTPNDPPFVNIKPGSGPRHVKFHPNGRWVYVISEIASTVTAFDWNPTNGTLAEFQTVSTLPADFKGVTPAMMCTFSCRPRSRTPAIHFSKRSMSYMHCV